MTLVQAGQWRIDRVERNSCLSSTVVLFGLPATPIVWPRSEVCRKFQKKI